MEMDELKNAWIALDNRLKRNEELKESIILEMMRSKAGKLVNRFIAWEIFQVVALILLIPVCIYWLDKFGGRYLAGDMTMYFGIAVCFFYSFWSVFKINGLMKIDLSKNVGNNILYMNRYNIQIKREKKIFWYCGWPAISILLVLSYASMKATLTLWFFLICAIIAGTLGSYWIYKRLYDKNIEVILKSLDEIKELKE